MRIQNNVAAFNAFRSLSVTQGNLQKSLEKLSSGFRINRAADDAAGLVISENLRSKLGGLRVASRNAQDAISVVQTAEGALQEVHSILQRMRDLAVQAANDTNDATARAAIAAEISDLQSELDRIANTTEFGNTDLLDGTAAFSFQVGPDGTANDVIAVSISAVNSASLAVSALTVSSHTFAQAAISAIDGAISTVSAIRGDLGAFQNRAESTIRNLGVAVENIQAAESRIRDTDFALETVNFTRQQILQQAGVAMLAQANVSSQSVLALLQ